jgi:hypothetical protein
MSAVVGPVQVPQSSTMYSYKLEGHLAGSLGVSLFFLPTSLV